MGKSEDREEIELGNFIFVLNGERNYNKKFEIVTGREDILLF